MSRKRDPKTPYRVSSYTDKGYRYAYTQPVILDPATGKETRRKQVIGTIDEHKRFTPNARFRFTDLRERLLYIWPADWDITAVNKLNNVSVTEPADKAGSAQHSEVPDGETVHPSGQSNDQYNNRLYGHFWYLEQLAAIKNLEADLLQVFDGDISMVDDVLTLAFYPLLSKASFNRLERWQRTHKTRSEYPLSESYITRLTQRITERHRMNLIRLRVSRQPEGSFAACDSTTKSGYGRCLVDLRWGRNKDRQDLRCSLLVVVYSLTTHEPIYYRRFSGNTNDMTVIRTIQADMKGFGITNLVFITDRGFSSTDNMALFYNEKIPFIMCTRVSAEPVAGCLQEVKYDELGLPINMDYSKTEQIYFGQFDARPFQGRLEDGNAISIEGIKVNAYLNINRRMLALQSLKDQIAEDEAYIKEVSSMQPVPSLETMRKKLRWYNVRLSKDAKAGEAKYIFTRRDDCICKEKAVSGFYASCMFMQTKTAQQAHEDYRLRNEQEEYFFWDKDESGANMQMVSTEESVIGRDFIRFAGLIPFSELKRVWKTTPLYEEYASSLEILDEMSPIRYSECTDGTSHMTTFTTKQVAICSHSGITPPDEVLTSRLKKAWQQKHAPKRRGRPPKNAISEE